MKIAFLGDLVIDRTVKIDFEVSRFLTKADCVIANLEGIIIKNGYRASPFKTYGSVIYNDYDAALRLINEAGITHVNLYNNHMIDYGEDRLIQTIEILNKAGVKILSQKNELTVNGEIIKLNNSGLVETFGIYNISEQYGQNINDMLLEKNPENTWANTIIHTHFGIEEVNGLSKYESQWFEHIAQFQPSIIIRHHPHCIQEPFHLNDVPCFPSIGDFAFNFNKKNNSKGLAVIFDTLSSDVEYRTIECKQYELRLSPEQFDVWARDKPITLSKDECRMLRSRYQSEYRENGIKSLKKSIKYFLKKEKPEHVLSMSTKHFIQPYILGDILGDIL